MKERKQTESFVDFLERFSENGTDVFWVYEIKSNKIIHVSQSYEHVYGKSCIGLLMQPDSFRDVAHPEDGPKVEDLLREIEKGQTSEFEYRIIHPSSKIKWISSRIIPFHLKGKHVWSVISSKDITNNKRISSSVHGTEKILNAILNKTSDFILLLDKNKKILLANKTVYRLFEIEQMDLIGMHISHLFPPELHEIMDFHFEKVIKSKRPADFLSHTGGKLNHCLHPIMNTGDEILGILYCIQGSPAYPFMETCQDNHIETNYSEVEIDIVYQAFKLLLTYQNKDHLKTTANINISNPFSALKQVIEARTITGLVPGAHQGGLEQVLSSRELQIANLIKAGMANKEIAQILNLSVRTVEAHRYKMRDKVGLKNRRKANLRNQLFFIHKSFEL